MYPILPVNIPFIGEVNEISIESLKFPLQPGKSYPTQVYVVLKGQTAFQPKNVVIPKEVTEQWLDDQVAFDYVISHLNSELAPFGVTIQLAPEVTEEPTEEPTE